LAQQTISSVALQAQNIVNTLCTIRNFRCEDIAIPQELKPDSNGNANWMTFCPIHQDTNTPSLHVSFLDKVLLKCRAGCDNLVIIEKLKSLNLWQSTSKTKFIVNTPAHEEPDDEYLRSIALNENGVTPDTVYSYRNEKNEPMFWVLRSSQPPKIIKPLCSVTYVESGTKAFAQVHMPTNRPLYNLPSVIVSTSDVLIVEGEKAADVAQEMFPEYAVTTWSGGTGAIAQTSWSVLKGRNVILFPDNDKPGVEAMLKIAKNLLALNCIVKIVYTEPQANLDKGYDVADSEIGDTVPIILVQNAQPIDGGTLTGPATGDFKIYAEDYSSRLIPIQVKRDILLVDITRYGAGDYASIPYVNYIYGSKACYAMEPAMIDVQGSKKPIYAIDEWATQIKDKMHFGIVYDPSVEARSITNNHNQKFFNIFPGFGSKAIADDQHRFNFYLEHIELLLGDNAQYFVDWIAHMVQLPKEKPGTYVIIKGPGGTGKSITGALICQLLGDSNAIQTTPKATQGSFNGILSGKLFVYIDEFYLESKLGHRSADDFKSLVTSDVLNINQKYEIPRTEPSYHRFMGTTNNQVPFTMDFDSRREIVFNAKAHKHTQDKTYFGALTRLIYNKDAMNGFMHYLKERKITHDIRRAPQNIDRQMLYRPTEPAASWIYGVLWDAQFPDELSNYFLKNEGASEISKWPSNSVSLPRTIVNKLIAGSQGNLGPTISTKVCEVLANFDRRQTRFDVRFNNSAVGELKSYIYVFPPVVALRRRFEEFIGMTINWPEVADNVEAENIVQMRVPF